MDESERYHSTGCQCAQCFGLAEFMLRLTGKTYGLPRAAGHAQEPSPVEDRTACESMTCICPDCAAKRAQMRPRSVRQPWEPRAARAA